MSDKEGFPCVNEQFNMDCEYPFCNCEAEYYEDDEVEDLVDLFEHADMEWREDYDGEE